MERLRILGWLYGYQGLTDELLCEEAILRCQMKQAKPVAPPTRAANHAILDVVWL